MNEQLPTEENPLEGGGLTKAERKQRRREEKRREQEQRRRREGRGRLLRWAAVVVGVAVVVGGFVMLSGRDDQRQETPGQLGLAVADTDWVKGPPDGSVTLVEYGDFQCPACASFHPVVQDLSEELGDRLRIVYRHFPLRQIHPQAQLAAQAAEAAGRQGKFWEMHDVLFERQADWAGKHGARDTFFDYADELGLNRGQFESDLDAGDVEDAIDQHYAGGVASGVTSTPTFYLNGEKLQGYNNFSDFSNQIRQAVEASS